MRGEHCIDRDKRLGLVIFLRYTRAAQFAIRDKKETRVKSS